MTWSDGVRSGCRRLRAGADFINGIKHIDAEFTPA
jgi:hypothetical protein